MITSYYSFPGLKYKGDLKPVTTKEIIIRQVCNQYNVSYAQLKDKNRARELTFARHLAMYVLKLKTGLTFKKIGELFNRDHTTAIHAMTVINNYMDTDENKRNEIRSFINTV